MNNEASKPNKSSFRNKTAKKWRDFSMLPLLQENRRFLVVVLLQFSTLPGMHARKRLGPDL